MAPPSATPRKRGRAAKLAAANGAATPTPDVIGLLNDLNSFCGIGSLDVQIPRRAGIGGEAPDDWLWLETPGPAHKPGKFSVEGSLIGLIDCGVARCTYRMVSGSLARVRVYILPDDVGRSMIPRNHEHLRKWLKIVMTEVDISPDGWSGKVWRCGQPTRGFISKPDEDKSSLSKLFNQIESPKPNPESWCIRDENTRELLRDVLSDENTIPGMRASLYKYQKRSVALMLERELAPNKTEDPRLRMVSGLNGEKYYLDFETMEIFESPRYYEDVKGGILAEEMGSGKTLICLAVILASKHQISYVPEECMSAPPTRPSVGSLSEMCVASVWRNAVPWTQFTESMSENCIKMIRNNHGFYEVPPAPRSRSSRYSYDRNAVERIYLGTGTIIVCPHNLVDQWEGEIGKHLEQGALKFLTLKKPTDEIPSVSKLLSYDVVIFSHTRFNKEVNDGRDSHGRAESYGVPLNCQCPYKGSTRVPSCVCFRNEDVYRSPLMSIHWKRLIVDEGQSMASSASGPKTQGVCVAEKLQAERRWIVTGTPTSLLVSVTPQLVGDESEEELRERKEREPEEQNERQIDEEQHLDRIGRMVCDFLKQKPWAPIDDRRNTEKASWKRYISKGFINRRPGSTKCVRKMFQRLFVRHQIEVVEEECQLPSIDVREIRLKPGFFEKLSMNLVVGALKANEVTSERVGKDYMFDPASRGSLGVLTSNLLRRCGFYPSGYSIADVESTISTSRKYMEKSVMRCGDEDIKLLLGAIEAGEMALATKMWRYISVWHDMVYFISDFPEQLETSWSISTRKDVTKDLLLNDADANTLLEIDSSKLQNLQKFVNAHGHESEIISKLEAQAKTFDVDRQNGLLAKGRPQNGGVESSLAARPVVQSQITGGNIAGTSPATPVSRVRGRRSEKTPPKTRTLLRPAIKRSKPAQILPPDSPLAKAKIVGTASIKLTYLINKILAHHKTEKILIFYEAEDVAGYIAQALEIHGIGYLWYSGHISLEKRSSHLDKFQRLDGIRVLSMNLKHAAHGLNITCASRLFFVNPVWRRDIEQQAIKRAYRIGQKNKVYVETLILEDTAEDEMWKRRTEMSQKEQNDAKDSLKDSKMRDIILNLKFLKVEPSDVYGISRENMLTVPEPVFGYGKHGGCYDDIEQMFQSNHLEPEALPVVPAAASRSVAGRSGQRVTSDLSLIDIQATSCLSTKVRWADAGTPPRVSPSSPGKRKVNGGSSAESSGELGESSSRSSKRKKGAGFKANDSRDWMEDLDDDSGALAGGKGMGMGRKKVNFA